MRSGGLEFFYEFFLEVGEDRFFIGTYEDVGGGEAGLGGVGGRCEFSFFRARSGEVQGVLAVGQYLGGGGHDVWISLCDGWSP